MAQAAQGGGAVTVLGGVEEPCGCGTEGCGQWARWDGVGLDLVILEEVFCNLNDTMILFRDVVSWHGGMEWGWTWHS